LRAIDFPKLRPAPDNAPDRAETGTQSHESIVGAGATRRERLVDAFERMHERDIELTRELWNGLAEIPGVRLYGPKYDALRTSLVSFTVSDVPSEEVSRYLAERGMFVSHGNFYAATVAEKLGVAEQGLVRIGCSIYTTLEEVRRLVEGVKEFVSERS
jgi:selenocysteine lyase/cysteine desulfurase